MNRKLWMLACCVFLMMVCSSTAFAESLYVTVNGGAVWAMDSDIKDGISGKAEFNTGFGVGGGVGYDFGSVRLEGEVEYRNSDYDKVGLNGFPKESASGSLKSLAFMLNGYYDFHNQSPFTPFIMGGVGGANVDTSRISGGGGSIPSDTSWQFAYQAGAGVALEFGSSWSLDISYRFFGTTDPEFDGIEMVYHSHNVLVGIRLRF